MLLILSEFPGKFSNERIPTAFPGSFKPTRTNRWKRVV